MLHKGDQVPHFTVHDVRGPVVSYKDVWQRKNLLFLSLPSEPPGNIGDYLAALDARLTELTAHDTAVVITNEFVEGLPCPGAVVADRYGAIHWTAEAASVDEMPNPTELIEWLRYVQMRCAG